MARISLILAGLSLVLLLGGCDSAEERAQSHYERGVAFAAAGDPVKASLEFRNVLQLKDDYVPAMFALAKIEEQSGQLGNAVALYRNAVERDAKHVGARVHLARILLAAGQLDNAMALADQAYALSRLDPDVLALKGAVALSLGNGDEATRFADEALKVDPNSLDALMLRAAERLKASDAKAAMVFLDKAEVKNERSLALQLLRLATLDALKDKQGIERVFVKLGELNPRDERFRDGLAKWYLSEGRNDEAEQVLRKFAAKNADNVSAQLVVAEFLGRQKGVEAAKAELTARIEQGGQVFPFRLALAELAFGNGDYPAAVETLTSLIADTSDPQELSTAKVRLAQMNESKKDWAGAGKLVDEVIAVDPKNADALTIRASIRVSDNEFAAAISDLRDALNEAPQSSRILLALADAYERSGDVALAEEQFVKAARLERFRPDVSLSYVEFLLRYGKVAQAERVLTEVRDSSPNDKRVLSLLAQLKLNRQDWAGAEEVAVALRKQGDQQSESAANQIVAAVLGAQKQYDASIELLKAVASRSPSQISPMSALVRAYVQAGKSDSAEAFLEAVLKDDPGNLGALVLQGSLAASRNKTEEAEELFKSAIRSSPNEQVGYQALAGYYLQLGRLEDAEKTARDGLLQKDDIGLRMALAGVLENAGKVDEAIGEYDAILKTDPLSVVAANNLASLLAEYRQDQESLNRAIAIAERFRNSDVPQILDTLGWIYYRKGDYPQAVTLLKAAADKLETVALVQFHLGMAYKGIGQKQLAMASLEKALELAKGSAFPQQKEAQAVLDALVAEIAAPARAN